VRVLESDFYGTGRAPWNGTMVLKQHWRLEQANPSAMDMKSELPTEQPQELAHKAIAEGR